MPLIRKMLISLGILFVIFTVISLFKPAQWEVHRSIEIQASPSKIFPYINDLHNWGEWYPWGRSTDVSMSVTYEGAESGKGAIKMWGGGSVKRARIEIVNSISPKGVWYTFDSASSKILVKGSIQISEKNGISTVVWQDKGDTSGNTFARFFSGSLDSVVGEKFEEGLANLKKAVEK